MERDAIYAQVQSHYGAAAKASGTSEYGRAVAKAFGYSEEELAATPGDSNLGLSCGNPTAMAALRQGETVIDLGSGAGFDVFLAAKKVGDTGRVIGVDMNKEMLARANRNKAATKASNTEFVESAITKIDLQSDIADCVISNCVINLVPEQDKQLVFNEIYRLLKPGGRVALSDTLAKKELTEEIKENMALYVGCVSGASRVQAYEEYLRNAGFSDIMIVDAELDLNAYTQTNADGSTSGQSGCCVPGTLSSSSTTNVSCCGSKERPSLSQCQVPDCGQSTCCAKDESAGNEPGNGTMYDDVPNIDFNEWAGSYKIYAVKPGTS